MNGSALFAKQKKKSSQRERQYYFKIILYLCLLDIYITCAPLIYIQWNIQILLHTEGLFKHYGYLVSSAIINLCKQNIWSDLGWGRGGGSGERDSNKISSSF